MRGIAVLWTVLLSLYAAFAYWHTSFKEPLSPAEITAYQAQLAQSATDAQRFPEAFAAFLTADDGGPFYMFNVMELRKHAKYPEGSSFDVTSGKEADSRYGAGVLPLLLARGSYPVISLNRQVTMLNEYEGSIGAFDKVAIVRYRSRRDLLDMISNDAFGTIEIHKWASLENTLVAPSSLAMLTPLGLMVPGFLLLIGLVLSAVLLWLRRARFL